MQVQFKFSLPADLKQWLEQEAKREVRSQGAQVVYCLRAAMQQAEQHPSEGLTSLSDTSGRQRER